MSEQDRLRRITDCLAVNSNRLQDRRRSPRNAFERCSQRRAVSTVKVNVIAAGIGDFKADSVSDNEGDRFCLQLSRVPRLRPIAPAVKQLVCVFVTQDSELPRGG